MNKVKHHKNSIINKIINGKIIRILSICLIVWVISFSIFVLLVMSVNEQLNKNSNDYTLVLGAGLWGKEPSLILRERLDAAITYKKLNPKTILIVSGGMGPGEDITEAEAMKKYLVEHGTSPSEIYIEDKSTSTYENFKYSKVIMEKLLKNKNEISKKQLTVITSDFHMLRSKFLASRFEFNIVGYTSTTPAYLYYPMVFREYFALIKSFLIDK